MFYGLWNWVDRDSILILGWMYPLNVMQTCIVTMNMKNKKNFEFCLLCLLIYMLNLDLLNRLNWGLTGLQEALQLYWADELLPIVRPAGNDAQQLLGYDNAQRVRQVGFINSSDEEWASWLQTGKRNSFSLLVIKVFKYFMKYCFTICVWLWKHIPEGTTYTSRVRPGSFGYL